VGAWSGESFGNDDAQDWAADLVASGDREVVRETLERVASFAADDYLEAPEGSMALAAAEVVAAAAGRPRTSDPDAEHALEWVAEHPEVASLAPLARKAVDRVTAQNSELRELWAEDPAVWAGPVEDLRGRLAD
jgi:hypothetical protein